MHEGIVDEYRKIPNISPALIDRDIFKHIFGAYIRRGLNLWISDMCGGKFVLISRGVDTQDGFYSGGGFYS